MDVFSNLMIAGECLLDERRTRAFRNAVERCVEPGDRVLDVGTGSGILALLAARAGASRVLAIEIAPDLAAVARANAEANGLGDVVEVVEADATAIELDEQFDVVTMELLDTGLVAEHQVHAMNRLHERGNLAPGARVLPRRYAASLQLVTYDFDFHGLQMPFVLQARNFGVVERVAERLTAPAGYLDIDLSGGAVSVAVEAELVVPAQRTGTANALLLRGRSYLDGAHELGATTDLNMPVIVPIEPVALTAGDRVAIEIAYGSGAGFEGLRVSVAKAGAITVARTAAGSSRG